VWLHTLRVGCYETRSPSNPPLLDRKEQMLGFEHRGHRLVRRTTDVGTRKMVLPQRCAQYGVGKRIGGAVYLHRQYEQVLGRVLEAAKAKLHAGFQYTVVKHNEQNGNVSFIH